LVHPDATDLPLQPEGRAAKFSFTIIVDGKRALSGAEKGKELGQWARQAPHSPPVTLGPRAVIRGPLPPAGTRLQKITFAEMRKQGVRGLIAPQYFHISEAKCRRAGGQSMGGHHHDWHRKWGRT
jgi:hypothetical protein